uniref:Uncharacterized protein n=1 Tax=Anguilla anguilla TaxID=7936 RepID=A0A0E9PGM2_ANGAN
MLGSPLSRGKAGKEHLPDHMSSVILVFGPSVLIPCKLLGFVWFKNARHACHQGCTPGDTNRQSE